VEVRHMALKLPISATEEVRNRMRGVASNRHCMSTEMCNGGWYNDVEHEDVITSVNHPIPKVQGIKSSTTR